MNTTYDISSVLDQLYDAEGIESMIPILTGTDISSAGWVDIHHDFGKISHFTCSLEEQNPELHSDIHEELVLAQDNSDDVDTLMLAEFYCESGAWFIIPVEETATRTCGVIMLTGSKEFNSECLLAVKDTQDTASTNSKKCYTTGKVTNIVKMVNSGENITDMVDGLDEEEEPTVLSFREF